MTSSARPSNDGGIVRPRALAVLRLMTNWNFSVHMTCERFITEITRDHYLVSGVTGFTAVSHFPLASAHAVSTSEVAFAATSIPVRVLSVSCRHRSSFANAPGWLACRRNSLTHTRIRDGGTHER